MLHLNQNDLYMLMLSLVNSRRKVVFAFNEHVTLRPNDLCGVLSSVDNKQTFSFVRRNKKKIMSQSLPRASVLQWVFDSAKLELPIFLIAYFVVTSFHKLACQNIHEKI